MSASLRLSSATLNAQQIRGRYWAGSVKAGNFTAELNAEYVTTTTCTVTDPAPAEGAGYQVIVRNGTATIGGVAYAAGNRVERIYHSGSWANRVRAALDVANNWSGIQTLSAGSLNPGANDSANLRLTGSFGGGATWVDSSKSWTAWSEGSGARWILGSGAAGGARTNRLTALDTGEFGFGVTPIAGNGLLQFPSGTTIANGIAFGDARLYRNSSNSLTTDGALVFDGATGKTVRINNSAANGAVGTTLGSVGPTGSTAGNPQGWMRISVAGTDRFIPFW